MFSGAALFAVVTAVVASILILQEVEVEEHALESKEDEIIALLGAVDARLSRLEQIDHESVGAEGRSRAG
ncbi:MAG TPA: hypothetical protein VK273_00770 [Gaiellaceae bacterium]|nr:hypothetical protein [Gaiellaceae bacterium]